MAALRASAPEEFCLTPVVSEQTITKLQALSRERAEKVVALIDDLAEIEALENADDPKAAREVLKNPGECITLG